VSRPFEPGVTRRAAPHQCGVAELGWKRGRARHSYTAELCFGLPIDQLSISDRERGLE
jgi:hypothetical protein